jgi:hypothetical protein
MPTPTGVFAQVAARHGDVDPNDAEAVQRWYAETVPALSPEKLETVLEDLLEQESDPHEPLLAPMYPRGVPLPEQASAPPVALPLLVRIWAAVFGRRSGR